MRNKDLIHQKIVSIQEVDDWSFSIQYKDRGILAYAAPNLENLDGILKNIQSRLEDKQPVIVTLNTSKNFKVITENFKKLAVFHKFFQLFVINPHSTTEVKWIIYPHTQIKIADPE